MDEAVQTLTESIQLLSFSSRADTVDLETLMRFMTADNTNESDGVSLRKRGPDSEGLYFIT